MRSVEAEHEHAREDGTHGGEQRAVGVVEQVKAAAIEQSREAPDDRSRGGRAVVERAPATIAEHIDRPEQRVGRGGDGFTDRAAGLLRGDGEEQAQVLAQRVRACEAECLHEAAAKLRRRDEVERERAEPCAECERLCVIGIGGGGEDDERGKPVAPRVRAVFAQPREEALAPGDAPVLDAPKPRTHLAVRASPCV